MCGRLDGRAALVTGASRGIGAAVARAFAAQGASVALAYEPQAEMEALARKLADELTDHGATAVAIKADLTDPAAAEALVQEAQDALCGLDVIVANAAAQGLTPWRDITVEQWDRVQAVNLRGAWLLARAAYPALTASEHASIITVTSVMVETGQVGQLHYTASKAGIIGLTRALARELGPDGIRVNSVMPGAIRTEHEMERVPDGTVNFDRIVAQQSLKRRGLAEDLAGTFVFLASGDSSFITGQVINVDGGWVNY